MCGIAGVISTRLGAADVTQRGEAMQKALLHRGPDSHGLTSFSKGNSSACLAHTRLSIIDLSDHGHQPMSSDDGRYTITYNGEIYNYQSLKDDLQSHGEEFVSESDTEVILKLYQRDAENCVEKLRGMFAFLIWDEQTQTAFAARDPLGIKPFYYWHNQQTLAFSSELRSIIKSELCSGNLSADGLNSYFTRGSFSEPATILKDVSQLPAGHKLSWANGITTIQEYAKIEFKPKKTNYSNAVKETRAALEDSVKAHLVGDVPVGIFLSGGIDSTALLALATQLSNSTVNTYSIAFKDPEWNEGEIAQRVADHFGSNHTELVMTRTKARLLFDDFLQSIDQPTIDGFNTFCVAKLAHERGEKVVISGLGGDELFAGYKSFKLLPRLFWLNRTTRFASGLFRFLSARFTPKFSPRLQRALDFLTQPASIKAAHQCLRGIFSNREAEELLKSYKQAPVKINNREPKLNHSIQDSVSEIELTTYLRNQLLRDSDVMSMAWGLELRVPFVDFKLFQTLARIPSKYRLRFGKRLLIDSVPEIPEWVVSRPKQGFRFPFDEWFSETWQQDAMDKELPEWMHLKPWYRAWNITVLDDWIKRHL